MDVKQELEALFINHQYKDVQTAIQEDSRLLQQITADVQLHQHMAVLSDWIDKRSYICIGQLGAQFGLPVDANNLTVIDSIWEENLFAKMHPDDVLAKHILELKLMHFLQKRPQSSQFDYSAVSRLRMQNIHGEYQQITHQIIYLPRDESKNMQLALCIYRPCSSQLSTLHTFSTNGQIINRITGELVEEDAMEPISTILSKREKEILGEIRKGLLSKEIAVKLSISLNTVNRHRQNILQKLQANNSMEAIKIAESMQLF